MNVIRARTYAGIMESRRLRQVVTCVLLMFAAHSAAPADRSAVPPAIGTLLFRDDFRSGLVQWHIEAERPGRIVAEEGVLDIEVPAGATLWFKHEMRSPVAIMFEATAVAAGGPHDRVSDLNCFWMARNRDGLAPVYARARSGRFSEYNDLLAYYVGLGGNGNTTTRFRRYIGDSVVRPLLPHHDLSAPSALLVANRAQAVMLIADGNNIQYWRDGHLLFQHEDAQPYTSGWFALRTTQSHLRIERLRVHDLAEHTRHMARRPQLVRSHSDTVRGSRRISLFDPSRERAALSWRQNLTGDQPP